MTLNDAIIMYQVSAWPTPTANDWKGSGPTIERADGKMRGDRLDYATEQMWATPSASVANDGEGPETWNARAALLKEKHGNGNGAGKPLTIQAQEQAAMWSTLRASDGEKGGPNQAFGAGGIPLPAQSVQWSTPSVADVQGGRMTRSKERNDELLLNGQADQLTSSLQDRIIYPVGQVSSHPRRSLNPLFVEWLMGWPPGWTLLVSTDFACSATELSLWKQRMRFALSQLGLPSEAPPAQLALFG